MPHPPPQMQHQSYPFQYMNPAYQPMAFMNNFHPIAQQDYIEKKRRNIKEMFEKYFKEASSNELINVTRNIIYDLMVYIDKNFEKIKDPRIKNQKFLSYCSDFDG